MKKDTRFSVQVVTALLSSLSMALRTANQAQSLPERRDRFRFVEEAIEQYWGELQA